MLRSEQRCVSGLEFQFSQIKACRFTTLSRPAEKSLERSLQSQVRLNGIFQNTKKCFFLFFSLFIYLFIFLPGCHLLEIRYLYRRQKINSIIILTQPLRNVSHCSVCFYFCPTCTWKAKNTTKFCIISQWKPVFPNVVTAAQSTQTPCHRTSQISAWSRTESCCRWL